MDFRSTIKLTYNSLRTKKSRTFLTMLGIIIGIASVIIIVSVGSGAQGLIVNQIKSMGSNLIGIFPGGSSEEEVGPPPSLMGIVDTSLRNEDIEALLEGGNVPNAVAVTYYNRGVATMQWGSNKYDGTFVCTTASYPEVHDLDMAAGRFFDKDEEKNLARVVILGEMVKEELFGDSDPLNKNIKITQSFQ